MEFLSVEPDAGASAGAGAIPSAPSDAQIIGYLRESVTKYHHGLDERVDAENMAYLLVRDVQRILDMPIGAWSTLTPGPIGSAVPSSIEKQGGAL